MNTNDIVAALFNNEISIEDIKKAIKIHDTFLTAASTLLQAGVTVTTSVPASAAATATVKEVAQRLGYNASDLAKFKAEHKAEMNAGSQWPFHNKITLIKEFRQRFGAGLAQAKYAVEMLYENRSDTSIL